MQVSGRVTIAVVCTSLAAVTIAAYSPVLRYDFVELDDGAYVVENHHVRRGLTLDGVKWAFSTGKMGNWHPLTWISLMLDSELFGLDAGLFHLTNLLLHTANAVLLLLVLWAMTGRLWPSAFVAAAFALHPLHIESVAWIAERKDVLSTLFWVLTMAAYVGYVRRGGVGRYVLVVLVFALGLTAKPMLVTLPFVLLLLDWWPLGRVAAEAAVSSQQSAAGEEAERHTLRRQRQKAQSGPSSVVCPPSSPAKGRLPLLSLVIEKLPLFVLAAASCVVTYITQQVSGAVIAMERVPLGLRLSNALVSYVIYIDRMIRPAGLAVLYPLLEYIPPWQPALAFALLAAATAAVILTARRRPYLAVGWLWYLGTLVPVIGLVQVGSQALADRYTYIPLTGLFIIAAWSAGDFCLQRRSLKPVAGAAAVLLLAAMFACTRNQIRHWENGVTLARRALKVTRDNYAMLNILGNALAKRDRQDEAIRHYRRAIQINPNYKEAHFNLALELSKMGRQDEAISHWRRALLIEPNFVEAHYMLGITLAETGRADEALSHYRRALQIKPDYAEAHYNLGNALLIKGRQEEAISHWRRALQIKPEFAKAHNNLAISLAATGRQDEAIRHFRRVLQIDPDYAEAHYKVAGIFEAMGRQDEAISHYRLAVQLQPEHPAAINNLAWNLATAPDPALRDPAEALSLARRACELTGHGKPEFLDTLAAAFAAGGRFDEAEKTAEKAEKLAEAAGSEALAREIRNHLEMFKKGRSYIEKAPGDR